MKIVIIAHTILILAINSLYAQLNILDNNIQELNILACPAVSQDDWFANLPPALLLGINNKTANYCLNTGPQRQFYTHL